MKTTPGLILSMAGLLLLTACGKPTEETQAITKNITERVFASGVIEAANTYTLTALTDGYLSKISFEEGDLVEAGQVLAVIDNAENIFYQESARTLYQISLQNTSAQAPAIQQSQAALELARQKLETDSLQWVRIQGLYAKNALSRAEYESYQMAFHTSRSGFLQAQESLKLTRQQAKEQLASSESSKNVRDLLSSNNQVKAAIRGKVYKKLKEPGDFVRQGESIALIGDPKVLYAKVNIDERNIRRVQVGQEAAIQLNTNPAKTYPARVSRIYPAFDEESQSFLCDLTFDTPLDFRVTGVQLQANIVVGRVQDALLIPRRFLDYNHQVSVKEKGKTKTRKVETNFISNEWVQVISGISPTDMLVTEKTPSNESSSSSGIGGANPY